MIIPFKRLTSCITTSTPMLKRNFIVFCAIIIFLAGCNSATPTAVSETPPVTPTQDLAPPPETIVAPTLAPSATPAPTAEEGATPIPRLAPEEWKKWPVIPTVTDRAVEIYRQGLAMGNDPQCLLQGGRLPEHQGSLHGLFRHPDALQAGRGYCLSQGDHRQLLWSFQH